MMDKEDEVAVSCLDMLRCASGVLGRHKAELARLLPKRGRKERGALERLVSDLTEVLSTASTSSGGSSSRQAREEVEAGEEQEEAAVSDSEAAARRGGGGGAMSGGGVKRAKAQQAAQAGMGQQQGLSSSSAAVVASEGRDALAIPEVMDHVMSFAEDTEVLGRLSRVCRLWRRVSEGEGLSLRVVEQHMPSALVGGASSLHATLGGSARRCLLAHNASMTGGRLMCGEERLGWYGQLTLLVEISRSEKVVCIIQGELLSADGEDGEGLTLTHTQVEQPFFYGAEPFKLASMGVSSVHEIVTSGVLAARICVVDVTTGVTASLFQGWLESDDDDPEPEADADGEFIYTTSPAPVTSMTYAGPPLQAQVEFCVRPCKKPRGNEMRTFHTDQKRLWKVGDDVEVRFIDQPSIYGERFIRTRLAEEAMAAKQHGSR